MLVFGSVHTSSPAPSARTEARTLAAPQAAPAQAEPAAGRPAYFSMISTISPGSLAAAYHSIRAQGAAGAGSGPGPAGDPAILSGLGIPSALSAYGEVLDED